MLSQIDKEILTLKSFNVLCTKLILKNQQIQNN